MQIKLSSPFDFRRVCLRDLKVLKYIMHLVHLEREDRSVEFIEDYR